ncbi:YheC/YheD family endospore coat-associated protein [Paenibacillus sp. CAU 1782]
MQHNGPVVGILYSPRLRPAARQDEQKRDCCGSDMAEPLLCSEIAAAAEQLGMAAFAFSAHDFDGASGKLFGLCLKGDRFIRRSVPLPDFLLDRRFPATSAEKRSSAAMLEQLRLHKRWEWLNGSLPSKLEVLQRLKEQPKLAPLLPPAMVYRSAAPLPALLKRYPQGLVLKPAAGMQGRGIIALKPLLLRKGYAITGKNRSNRDVRGLFPDEEGLTAWLERWTKGTTYLLQPYLPLRDADNRPFDIRVLLQKNEKGAWSFTGAAARIGAAGRLTSNLHGGGEAEPALSKLGGHFGVKKSRELLDLIMEASSRAARSIEEAFGRFCELAFDFGVEPTGKVWLLEANSKPGRQSFRHIGDAEAQALSALRPLLYARYLAGRSMPVLPASQSATGRANHRDIPIRKGAAALNVQEVHR